MSYNVIYYQLLCCVCVPSTVLSVNLLSNSSIMSFCCIPLIVQVWTSPASVKCLCVCVNEIYTIQYDISECFK